MSDERYEEEEYEEDDVENSAEDEYEEEYSDDAESSDEDPIDGTDEADEEMEHVEWGFEPRKRRFSREVVLGLIAVAGLVGVFAFVVHNQFSGDGGDDSQLADTDDSAAAPAGSLGPEGDPNAADDPFADSISDSGSGNPDATAVLIGETKGGPPNGGDALGDPLAGQSEPDLDSLNNFTGTADPFANQSPDPLNSTTPGPGTTEFGIAARDSVYGTPEADTPPNSEFLPQPEAGLPDSGLDSSSLPAAGLPADDSFTASSGLPGPAAGAGMLPEDNRFDSPSPGSIDSAGAQPLGSEPLSSDPLSSGPLSSDSFSSEPFSSEPAVSSASTLPDEQPRGLFDGEPAGGPTASRSGELVGNGQSRTDGLNQPSGPSPSDSDFFSGPASGVSSLNGQPNGVEVKDFDNPSGLLDGSDDSDLPSGPGGLLSGTESSLPEASGTEFGGGIAGTGLPGAATGLPQPSSGSEETVDGFRAPIVTEENSAFGAVGSASVSPFGNPDSVTNATGSETMVRAFDGGQPASFGGTTYTVQENDSFWSISRRVYGTPKYFEALQRYNRSKVADPKKLKPGMQIDTPSPAVLADYTGDAPLSPTGPSISREPARTGLPVAAAGLPATALSGTSPAGLSGEIVSVDPVTPAEPVRTAASSPAPTAVSGSGQAGFFIGNQGYPLYRVASGDTLTAIAADHLGRASRWKQIYRMNQDALKSPDDLAPGLVLKLPGDASRVPLIDRTSSLR